MSGRVDVLPEGSLEAECVAELLRDAGHTVEASPSGSADVVVLVGVDPVLAREALAEYRRTASKARVLVLVPSGDALWTALSRSCGASRVLSIQSTPSELYGAVSELIEMAKVGGLTQAAPPETLDDLTKREGEVAVLLVNGWRNEEIARSLGISKHTVRTHVQHILAKLGVHHRHALTQVVPNLELVPRPRHSIEQAVVVMPGGG